MSCWTTKSENQGCRWIMMLKVKCKQKMSFWASSQRKVRTAFKCPKSKIARLYFHWNFHWQRTLCVCWLSRQSQALSSLMLVEIRKKVISRWFQAGIISVAPFSAYLSSTGDPRHFANLLFVGLSLTLHPLYTKDINRDCPNAVLSGL